MKANKKNAGEIIFAAIFAAFVGGFLLTMPHWWLRVSTAKISYNGKQSSGSRLYRARNGELILALDAKKEFSPYWITPAKKKVYAANPSNFMFFRFGALAHHNDQYGVNLEYTAKTDIDPQIVSGKNFIEFTSLKKQRVRIEYQ